MNDQKQDTGSHRDQLLAKLSTFEEAIEPVHPDHRVSEDWKQRVANLRHGAEKLRLYLAEHLPPKEVMQWRELPDADAEFAAFASELKMEHADLVRELKDLIKAIDNLPASLDRRQAALQIHSQAWALAHRIARHAGSEAAEFGRYS